MDLFVPRVQLVRGGGEPPPAPSPRVIATTVHCPGRARGNPPHRDGEEHLNPSGGSTEFDNSESLH
jgi:hypothetical protein